MNEFENKRLNLYEMLEVEPFSTFEQIKTAYRKLSRKYHPDVNPDCIDKFKQIKNAYEILSDSEQRAKYDALNGFKKETFQQKAQAKQAYSTNDFEKEKKENKKNIFENFSDIFNDVLDSVFEKNFSKKQKDIFLEVHISETEALCGTNRMVNVLHTKICPKCFGKRFVNSAVCSFCNGEGELKEHKKINVKIEPYTKEITRIKIKNEGNRSEDGTTSGNLYLIVKIDKAEKKNFDFKLVSGETFTTVELYPQDCVLGCDVKIKNPKNEDIKLKILPFTNADQKFRLSDEGLFDVKTNKQTDLIVQIKIVLPAYLKEEEIELYRKLRENSARDMKT